MLMPELTSFKGTGNRFSILRAAAQSAEVLHPWPLYNIQGYLLQRTNSLHIEIGYTVVQCGALSDDQAVNAMI